MAPSGTATTIPTAGRYRVLYASSERLGTFVETLAPFRPDPAVVAGLREIDAESDDARPVASGTVPKEWLMHRSIGSGRSRGRYVDIGAAETLAELRVAMTARLVHHALDDLDAAAIRMKLPRRLTPGHLPVHLRTRRCRPAAMGRHRVPLPARRQPPQLGIVRASPARGPHNDGDRTPRRGPPARPRTVGTAARGSVTGPRGHLSLGMRGQRRRTSPNSPTPSAFNTYPSLPIDAVGDAPGIVDAILEAFETHLRPAVGSV